MNAADEWGNTPLMNASGPKSPQDSARQVQTVELLLRHGAEVNRAEPLWLEALHGAARETDPTILKLLLAHGADLSRKVRSAIRRWMSPRRSNRRANAYALLDAGATPSADSGDGDVGGRAYRMAAQYMEGKHRWSMAADYYRAAAAEFVLTAARCREMAKQAEARANGFTWWDDFVGHLGDGADTREQEYSARDAEQRRADEYDKLAEECKAKAAAIEKPQAATLPR